MCVNPRLLLLKCADRLLHGLTELIVVHKALLDECIDRIVFLKIAILLRAVVDQFVQQCRIRFDQIEKFVSRALHGSQVSIQLQAVDQELVQLVDFRLFKELVQRLLQYAQRHARLICVRINRRQRGTDRNAFGGVSVHLDKCL